MSARENTLRALPDVAGEAQPGLAGRLDWVGMDEIQMPVLIAQADGTTQRVSAKVSAFVNLDRADAWDLIAQAERLRFRLVQVARERDLMRAAEVGLGRHELQ